MAEATYEPVLDSNNPEEKRAYWEVAFGLQAVDGLAPSRYMRSLADEHIAGTKTYAEVDSEITGYYNQNLGDVADKEADIVSDAIYRILGSAAFRFDITTLKGYHRQLFEKLDAVVYHPGEFRTVNLTKKEPILGGETVQYQDYGLIQESLAYDFNEERQQNYTTMTLEEKIARLTTFVSRIWQVHPFYEGNTRTTAVFLEKYLMSLGYKVDNEILRSQAKEFRDALVLANYSNIPHGIQADATKLREFVAKFLQN